MSQQEPLPIFDFSDVVGNYARGDVEGRGVVFTRREVVEFILDLVEYTADRPLYRFRLLEPSSGNGDFLLPAVERLLIAYKSHCSEHSDLVGDLSDAIRAVEVHRASIESASARLLELLHEYGVSAEDANRLLEAWIIEGDFLLVELPWLFTHT